MVLPRSVTAHQERPTCATEGKGATRSVRQPGRPGDDVVATIAGSLLKLLGELWKGDTQ
jgi:hypothetical protein